MQSSRKKPTARRGSGRWHGVPRGLLPCAALLLAAGAAWAGDPPLLPPTLTATFTPSQVNTGGSGTTTLTITVTNPNPTPLEGILSNIVFSDTYPAGLVLDSVSSNSCGTEAGTAGFSANFTATGFGIDADELVAGGSCTIVLLMHAGAPGNLVDTTSAIIADGTLIGAAASATLTATPLVPTLGRWSLIGFGLLLGTAVYRAARRRAA